VVENSVDLLKMRSSEKLSSKNTSNNRDMFTISKNLSKTPLFSDERKKKKELGKLGFSKGDKPILITSCVLAKNKTIKISHDDEIGQCTGGSDPEEEDLSRFLVKDESFEKEWREKMLLHEMLRKEENPRRLMSADVKYILSGPEVEFTEMRSIAIERREEFKDCKRIIDVDTEFAPRISAVVGVMLTSTCCTAAELVEVMFGLRLETDDYPTELQFVKDIAILEDLLQKKSEKDAIENILSTMAEYEIYAERKCWEAITLERSGRHHKVLSKAMTITIDRLLLAGIPHGISALALKTLINNLNSRTRLGVDIPEANKRIDANEEWWDDSAGTQYMDKMHTLVLNLRHFESFSSDGLYRLNRRTQEGFPFPLYSHLEYNYTPTNEFGGRIKGAYTIRVYLQAVHSTRKMA